jgi:hypothetical protein
VIGDEMEPSGENGHRPRVVQRPYARRSRSATVIGRTVQRRRDRRINALVECVTLLERLEYWRAVRQARRCKR